MQRKIIFLFSFILALIHGMAMGQVLLQRESLIYWNNSSHTCGYNDLRESFVCFLFPQFLQKRCRVSRGLLHPCDVGDNREPFGGTDGFSLLYKRPFSSFECQKLVLTLFFLPSCSNDLIPLKQLESFVWLSMEYISIGKWTFFSPNFIYILLHTF